MKRDSKTKKINQIFSEFFHQKNSNQGDVINPLTIWIKVMGKHIVSETKAIYVKKNILFISIKNPYLRSDLISQKEKILIRINKISSSINDVRFH